jgi:alkanesulfonate monooxygenase SsuD/methylene tetrahydromethanopterin reductase-like flavin-dependent oxidoreductase (luciferase family)
MPGLSARVRIELGKGPESFHTIHGTPEECAAGIRAYGELGVDHLALAFPPRDADGLRSAVERFIAEVMPLV